jgi:2-phospho-L-lactate guanylyltransferase
VIPLVAIVPAKRFDRAKTRLAEALPPLLRTELASHLFDHVLSTLRALPSLSEIVVVTDGADVEASPSVRGSRVLFEDAGSGLHGAVKRGLEATDARCHRLVVMADLPFVTPADFDELISRLGPADVVLAPDRHGEATNALAIAANVDFSIWFGTGNSLEKHLAEASRRNLRLDRIDRPGLSFDLDTVADLNAYRERSLRLRAPRVETRGSKIG